MGGYATLPNAATLIALIAIAILPLYALFELLNLVRKQRKAALKERISSVTAFAAGAGDEAAQRIASGLVAAVEPGATEAVGELKTELDLLALQAIVRPTVIDEVGLSLIAGGRLTDLDPAGVIRLKGELRHWLTEASATAERVLERYVEQGAGATPGLDSAVQKYKLERFFEGQKRQVLQAMEGVLASVESRGGGIA